MNIIAGDTFTYTYSNSAYSADDGWTLTYSLVASDIRYDIPGTGSGNEHTFTALPAETATWRVDNYRYYITADDGTNRATVEKGHATVAPNPTVGTFDTRTFAAKMLDAVEKTLLGEATDEQLHILRTNHGITAVEQDIEKLQALRVTYKKEADADKAKEDVAAGKANPYKIQTRFTIR